MPVNPLIEKAAKEWPVLEAIDIAEKQYGKEGDGSFLGRAVIPMDRSQATVLFSEVTTKASELIAKENKRIAYWNTIEKILFIAGITLMVLGTVFCIAGAGTVLETIGAITFVTGCVSMFLSFTVIEHAKKGHSNLVNKYQPDFKRFEVAKKRLHSVVSTGTDCLNGNLKGSFTQWENVIRREAQDKRREIHRKFHRLYEVFTKSFFTAALEELKML